MRAAADHGYGSYTIDASGHWTYSVDNSNSAVQALNVGEHADRHVHGDDGRRHAQQVITVTINGANDAAVIAATVTGTAIEAGGVNNGTPGSPMRRAR